MKEELRKVVEQAVIDCDPNQNLYWFIGGEKPGTVTNRIGDFAPVDSYNVDEWTNYITDRVFEMLKEKKDDSIASIS